jgi:hypothetical protein
MGQGKYSPYVHMPEQIMNSNITAMVRLPTTTMVIKQHTMKKFTLTIMMKKDLIGMDILLLMPMVFMSPLAMVLIGLVIPN